MILPLIARRPAWGEADRDPREINKDRVEKPRLENDDGAVQGRMGVYAAAVEAEEVLQDFPEARGGEPPRQDVSAYSLNSRFSPALSS